jgi:hypothetical protein
MLCEHCFQVLNPLNKSRKEFFINVLCLFLSIKGKINFLQLERYGENCGQTARNQFQESFEFLPFNAALVSKHCSARTVIGFDPTYLPKSGKKTEGVGKFWSGCAGAPKWGLEMCGIAAIDLDNHTAMHLEAVQTLPEADEKLLGFYAKILTDRKDVLQKIANIVVVDAYFSKETFVTPVCKEGFHIVSRLRNDVRMTCIIEPVKTGKRGRPKTVGDKVDVKNLDLNYFSKVATENPDETVYTAVVKATALERNIRVVIVQKQKNGKANDVKIYFSTDTEMSAEEVLEIYRTRFQIEFLYRDAKQHTGLTNAQARSKEKLHFHCNMSLTAVSLAKAVHWLSIPKEKRKAFSMANVKTMNHNELLLNRFLCVFGLKPNILKNNQNVKELLLYGTIAA